MSNVCLGDAVTLMPLDHLTLAEYLKHPDAQFLAEFGSRHPPAPPSLDVSPEVLVPEILENQPDSVVSSETSTVTPLGDISDRCYRQLDL